MRSRALFAVGVAVVVLAGAAVVPIWLNSSAPRSARVEATVVPFELSGLYVSECGAGRESRRLPDACIGPYQVGRLTPSPAFDGFHRALYYGYLAGELVPCLEQHGYTVDPPSRDDVRGIDVSAWYLTVVLQEQSNFGQAISAWYDCPLVPSYLEDSARGGPGVVE